MTGNNEKTDDLTPDEMRFWLCHLIGFCMADREKLVRSGMFEPMAALAVRLGVSRSYFYPASRLAEPSPRVDVGGGRIDV